MSLNLPPITAPFITRARYIEETLRYLLQNTSKLYYQILTPPPHPWTAVTHFKIAHAVLMQDLSDLRQFMSTHLSEEAQILEKQGKREYPTEAKRTEAMEIYQEGFDVVRDLLNYLDDDIRVMTVVGEIIRWNDENRGMGTTEDFWEFAVEELAPAENLDPGAVQYVFALLEDTIAHGVWD
ncbi:hypothetical protein RUND412_003730 [Rhizina undulata]